MAPLIRSFFAGGDGGEWVIERIDAVRGESLPSTGRLAVLPERPAAASWCLEGVTAEHRYTERAEKQQLLAVQAALGRPEATCAALIPISKSAAWWELAQDERREVFEAKSAHIAGTLKYLPAIARRLYHSRSLGGPSPGGLAAASAPLVGLAAASAPRPLALVPRPLALQFDFLTWFEFAPEHRGAFDELVAMLRQTPEWRFVEREVDVRLVRATAR